MDAILALALREELGELQFQKFLQALNGSCRSTGRLFYWQEKALARVAEKHPEYARLAFDDVVVRLSLCQVHGVALEHGEREIETWPAYSPGGFAEKSESAWPNALLVLYVRDGQKIRRDDRQVLFCPACRKALLEWNRGRTRKYGIPQDFDLTDERTGSTGRSAAKYATTACVPRTLR